MTTAATLIEDALVEIGVKEDGQAVPSEDQDKALRMLNRILGRWANRRLTLPVLTTITIPLDGSAAYSVGPTGDVVAARPVKVNAARMFISGTEYGVNVLSRQAWDAIGVKAVSGGVVSDVWYSSAVPDGSVHVYPRATAGTLELDCQCLFAAFADETTDVDVPEGYEDALALELAFSLCASYGLEPGASLVQRRNAAMRAIKATNSEPINSPHELSGGRDYEIERGY